MLTTKARLAMVAVIAALVGVSVWLVLSRHQASNPQTVTAATRPAPEIGKPEKQEPVRSELFQDLSGAWDLEIRSPVAASRAMASAGWRIEIQADHKYREYQNNRDSFLGKALGAGVVATNWDGLWLCGTWYSKGLHALALERPEPCTRADLLARVRNMARVAGVREEGLRDDRVNEKHIHDLEGAAPGPARSIENDYFVFETNQEGGALLRSHWHPGGDYREPTMSDSDWAELQRQISSDAGLVIWRRAISANENDDSVRALGGNPESLSDDDLTRKTRDLTAMIKQLGVPYAVGGVIKARYADWIVVSGNAVGPNFDWSLPGSNSGAVLVIENPQHGGEFSMGNYGNRERYYLGEREVDMPSGKSTVPVYGDLPPGLEEKRRALIAELEPLQAEIQKRNAQRRPVRAEIHNGQPRLSNGPESPLTSAAENENKPTIIAPSRAKPMSEQTREALERLKKKQKQTLPNR